ncbi:MAG: hypothetical protein IPL61_39315 [Myxococcales bacterium]|nr:hypothetical protein [Myxococcales bacterium]
MSRLLASFVLALTVPAVACSGGSGGGGAPPPKPATGAPLTFQVTKVTPGERGALDVKAYNFSDKTVAGYGILMRYADKDGQRVKVKVGTPFEKDFDFWSMSGKKYACKPRSWCSFELDHLEIPATAAKAEVIASSLRVLAADGMKFEDADLWALDRQMEWPESVQ